MKKEGAASSFPGIYAPIAAEKLLSAFEAAPVRMERALEGLTPPELSARPIPGKWAIQEIVAHVADSETCGALRIRLALAQPGSLLPAYDQDRFAEALGYGDLDAAGLAGTLELFGRLRAHSARLFRRARASDWALESRHAQWGPVTVRQLLELYADHGERHLAQILERRRMLGRPLALEPLLPERLY
jgi:hypothetical protein